MTETSDAKTLEPGAPRHRPLGGGESFVALGDPAVRVASGGGVWR